MEQHPKCKASIPEQHTWMILFLCKTPTHNFIVIRRDGRGHEKERPKNEKKNRLRHVFEMKEEGICDVIVVVEGLFYWLKRWINSTPKRSRSTKNGENNEMSWS